MKVAQLFRVRLCVTPWTIYSPWNSSGQNIGVGSLSLLQWILQTQESTWGLLHGRRILYQLSYQGSPEGRCLITSLPVVALALSTALVYGPCY